MEDDAFLDVAEGFVDYVVEEEVEECWGKDTSLADAVVYAERLGDAAACFDCGLRVAVKFLDEALQFAREA